MYYCVGQRLIILRKLKNGNAVFRMCKFDFVCKWKSDRNYKNQCQRLEKSIAENQKTFKEINNEVTSSKAINSKRVLRPNVSHSNVAVGGVSASRDAELKLRLLADKRRAEEDARYFLEYLQSTNL